MEIIRLRPAGKDYLWGGTRLREEYGKTIPLTPLAETWECSTHPDGLSRVEGGTFDGQTLAAVLEGHPEFLGTKLPKAEGLPILVKFIDAKKDLSVQVHPDDAFARAQEGENGKTEMWYVMDAAPGAKLIYGFEHPVTPALLKTAVDTGTLAKHLHRMKVQKGDVCYVPAGTVHGIGAGALIAEIQECSNLTYRVYDYDRVDKNGKKRELHFDKALQVMDFSVTPDSKPKSRLVHYYPGCSRENLCSCRYFQAERVCLSRAFSFTVMETSFQVLLCLEGRGNICADGGGKLAFRKGECLFLPAGLGRCHVDGTAELLKIRC